MLWWRRAFPMLAASKAVVDLDGARLAKYSSGLVFPPTTTLVGVIARDRTGDLRGKDTDVRLPEVLERR